MIATAEELLLYFFFFGGGGGWKAGETQRVSVLLFFSRRGQRVKCRFAV